VDPIDPDDAGSERGHWTSIYRTAGVLAGLGAATGAVVAGGPSNGERSATRTESSTTDRTLILPGASRPTGGWL